MDTAPPPGYAPAPASSQGPPRRTIQDLRAQILANASVIKPNPDFNTVCAEEHQQLIVAKTSASSSSAKSAAGTGVGGGKHYAVIMRRYRDEIKIAVIGEERDTVEEALEWMLEHTERILDDMVEAHGRVVDDKQRGPKWLMGYSASKWGKASSSSS